MIIAGIMLYGHPMSLNINRQDMLYRCQCAKHIPIHTMHTTQQMKCFKVQSIIHFYNVLKTDAPVAPVTLVSYIPVYYMFLSYALNILSACEHSKMHLLIPKHTTITTITTIKHMNLNNDAKMNALVNPCERQATLFIWQPWACLLLRQIGLVGTSICQTVLSRGPQASCLSCWLVHA